MAKVVTSYKEQNPNTLRESSESAKMTDEQKYNAVKRYVYANLNNRGLFVFHLYREDVIQDVYKEILEDRQKYGKSKSVGIYCSKAYQFSLTKQAYYTAKKRRDFFMADSLDRELNNSDGGKSVTVGDMISSVDYSYQQVILLEQIRQEFGEVVYKLTKKVLACIPLETQDLELLRKTKGLAEMLKQA